MISINTVDPPYNSIFYDTISNIFCPWQVKDIHQAMVHKDYIPLSFVGSFDQNIVLNIGVTTVC